MPDQTISRDGNTIFDNLNLDEVTISIDNMACSCDHTTYVARVPGPADESGERIDIPIGKICVKKKTWFFTEIKHIVVREELRRRGIAKMLINYLIESDDEIAASEGTIRKIIFTPLVGGTVKLDNQNTQNLLLGMGFILANTFVNTDTSSNLAFLTKSLNPVVQS